MLPEKESDDENDDDDEAALERAREDEVAKTGKREQWDDSLR